MGSHQKRSIVALAAALGALAGLVASSIAKKSGGFTPAEVIGIVDENSASLLQGLEDPKLALSAFKESPIDAAELCVQFVVGAACDVLELSKEPVGKSDLVEAIAAFEAIAVSFLGKLSDGFQVSDAYLALLQNTGALFVGVDGIEDVGAQLKANARGQILAAVAAGFGLARQFESLAG